MKIIFLTLLFCISLNSFSQTKKIAFKSHSGAAENFTTALENDLFDMDNSNFGQAPVREINEARLDSVIFVSDSQAIMVTSEYCISTRIVNAGPTLWKAGKDSVYNHPLFSHQHSLDSIKNVLKLRYYFRNPIDSVVFIGYDNGKEKLHSQLIPVMTDDTSSGNSPFDRPVLGMLGLVFILSLLAGVVAWKYKLPAGGRFVTGL